MTDMTAVPSAVDMTVQDIMRERGVQRRQAQTILKRLRTDSIDTSSVPHNQKAMIVTALHKLGGSAERAADVQREMQSEGFTIDIHNLTHALWATQKDGMTVHRERKHRARSGQAGDSALTKIRLTPKGTRAAKTLLGEADEPYRPARVVQASSGRHAVGHDGTDYRNHGQRAVGGPIERIMPVHATPTDDPGFQVVPRELAQEVRSGRTTIIAARRAAQLPPRQNERTEVTSQGVAEPVSDDKIETPPTTSHPSPITPASSSDTPTQYREPVHTDAAVTEVTLDWQMLGKDFPLIGEIVKRDQKAERYRAAVKLIEDDEDEIALSLLDKIKFTELEQEVLRLIRQMQVPFERNGSDRRG